MTNIRQTAITAFVTALKNSAQLTGIPIKRGASGPARTVPAIYVFQGGHDVNEENFDQTTYLITATVECHLSAESDELLDELVNDYWARIVRAALSDRTLGGAVTDVREGPMEEPDVERKAGTKPSGSFATTFELIAIADSGSP